MCVAAGAVVSVHVQAMLSRDAPGNGRFAGAAAAADPVDVLQPCPQRRGTIVCPCS